jgi:hypothetical protein
MSTDPVPSTTPQAVLFSLIAEDRPWTVEEIVREKGNGSQLDVVDALAELEAWVSSLASTSGLCVHRARR